MIFELERKGLEAAQEDGILSGLETSNQATDCPFDHHQHAKRSAWLLGFSNGRTKMRALHRGSFRG
jgi:ribosome modulation factor